MDIPTVNLKVFSIGLGVFSAGCIAIAVAWPSTGVHLVILAVISLVLAFLMHTLN